MFVKLLDRDFRVIWRWPDRWCFPCSQSKTWRPKSWTAFCKSSSSDETFFFWSSSESELVHPIDPCLIFPFIFSNSLRYDSCATMLSGLFFIFSIRLVNIYWFFLVRSLDFWIFEFSNFRLFGIFSNSDSLSLQFYSFRISNIFSTSFYGVYEGLILLFYLFFIKIYKNALFSEQNPIAKTGRV